MTIWRVFGRMKLATKWTCLLGGNQNMNKRMLATLMVICIVILTSCQRRVGLKSLHRIKIGKTKKDVIQRLGEPFVCRGSIINDFNQIIDVWEYTLFLGPIGQNLFTDFFLEFFFFLVTDGTGKKRQEDFLLFFCDDKLIRWCKAGDWKTAQHNIQEVRFR